MLKHLLKTTLAKLLWWQVHRLDKRNAYKVVAVTGSIGKTSTKRAVAQYLGSAQRVQYQEGNYNDIVSVPLIYFGLELPALYNPFAWIQVFLRIERQIRRPYPFDIVVLELGTDAPGQIDSFSQFVRPDVAIVTAVTPEHMEAFGSLDEVAKEEMSVVRFSRHIILNTDDVPVRYRKYIKEFAAYGSSVPKKSTLAVQVETTAPHEAILRHDKGSLVVNTRLIGQHLHKTLAAAYLTGEALEVVVEQPSAALEAITGMPGRMQRFTGKQGATIIDDTYNASPEAVNAALDVLYELPARRKIAVIGNMNEMGGYAKKAHEEVVQHLESSQLSEVITIGPEAELFFVPAAQKKGINVKAFSSPYAIGAYLLDTLQPDTAILFKGSQNGVFLEEAIKPLLEHEADAAHLVRQSPVWLKKKAEQFPVAKS